MDKKLHDSVHELQFSAVKLICVKRILAFSDKAIYKRKTRISITSRKACRVIEAHAKKMDPEHFSTPFWISTETKESE